MNPKTVQALTKNVPELQELIAFLKSEAARLNDLSTVLAFSDPQAFAFEARSRQLAYQLIQTILAPLINTPAATSGVNPEEYVV